MKLFLYFITHYYKNTIKRLMKSWVGIMIAVILGISVLSLVFNIIDDKTQHQEVETQTEDDEKLDISYLELALGGVGILLLAIGCYTAGKSGAEVFTMPDVEMLFPAPKKPQYSLIFCLLKRIVYIVILGLLYAFLYISNLKTLFDINSMTSAVAVLCIFMFVGYMLLIKTMIFVICSEHSTFRKAVPFGVLGLLGAVCIAFAIYARSSGENIIQSALSFFNGKFARFIPVWGWIKHMVVYSENGEYLKLLLSFLIVIAGAALIFLITWRMKADFYEEAITGAEKKAAAVNEMQKSGKIYTGKTNKKERSEKLQKDGLVKGFGASALYYREMYNRKRFADLGFFTKTSEMYLIVTVVAAITARIISGEKFYVPIAAIIVFLSYCRTLGGSLGKNIDRESFMLIPDTTRKKTIFLIAADMMNAVLDILPATVASAIIMSGKPADIIIWFLFAVSVSFFGENIEALISLSQPLNLEGNLKRLFMVLFLYAGIVPDSITMIAAAAFGYFEIGVIISTVLNIGLGFMFFFIYTAIPEKGRK